ncbi:branched-chain amino acid aminotransferase [uncultured Metabacillus sp.]|uniref:branched-chain amino acid aminotransferase n=1 Tax=uncultured Metabacillus sp. TaxID=2860135 RepID=UPI002631872D|nr:branched-chain amino acid aminotransferase [uncultured Metabacillus sp.]
MLKDVLKQFIVTEIEKLQKNQQKGGIVEIYKEEKDYIERHQIIDDNLRETFTFKEKKPITRFDDAYIERGIKETEEVIDTETSSFLTRPVKYLKEHMDEFIYIETKWLELIGVDAISLEVDDVFKTYDALLGLKLQKKHEKVIRNYLIKESVCKDVSFDLIYNQKDGMWDLNVSLECLQGFIEEITLGEAMCIIYRFLFKLVETVEEEKMSTR